MVVWGYEEVNIVCIDSDISVSWRSSMRNILIVASMVLLAVGFVFCGKEVYADEAKANNVLASVIVDTDLVAEGFQETGVVHNPGPSELIGFAVYIQNYDEIKGFQIELTWPDSLAEFRKTSSGIRISDDILDINGEEDLELAPEQNVIQLGGGTYIAAGETNIPGYYTKAYANQGGEIVLQPEGLLFLAVFRTSATIAPQDSLTVDIAVKVSDAAGVSQDLEPVSYIFKPVSLPTEPPVILTDELPAAEFTKEYEAIIEVEDPDVEDEWIFELVEGPAWLTIDPATGVLSGVPEDLVEKAVQVDVIVRVTDLAELFDERSYALDITDPVSVEDDMPMEFAVSPAYPNPFNPSTAISYTLPQESRVELAMYDMLGRRVAVLAEGNTSAGSHTVVWNGTDAEGRTVSSGVYLYRLTAGSMSATGKVMFLR